MAAQVDKSRFTNSHVFLFSPCPPRSSPSSQPRYAIILDLSIYLSIPGTQTTNTQLICMMYRHATWPSRASRHTTTRKSAHGTRRSLYVSHFPPFSPFFSPHPLCMYVYVRMYINEPSKPTNTTIPFAEPHPSISH